MFGIFALMAEFERNLLSERTKAGVAAARARGVQIGRKRQLTDAQEESMLKDIRTTRLPLLRIAAAYKISKTCLYNYCPGGRLGLAERDAAATTLLESGVINNA